jgi:XTP/dITP diphosphohydrolase
MNGSKKVAHLEIVVATRNLGKLKEIEAILKNYPVRLLSLKDFPAIPEIPEDGTTFAENAAQKARTVARLTGRVAIADDSGLTVDALQGRPGVYSSRYAGENATDEDRYRKLLKEMESIPDGQRQGAFVCAAAVASPSGETQIMESEIRGSIAFEPHGRQGFGYDPVFFVPELGRTVAELEPDLKNRISHRAKALEKLKVILPKFISPNP